METISRELDVAWLAGIVDGEGWIGCYDNKARRHRQLKVNVGNTDPYMIWKVTTILKSLGLKFYYSLQCHVGYKEMLSVEVSGNRNVYKLLTALLPHLTRSAPQAKLIIDYLDWRFQFNEKGPAPEDIKARQENLIKSLTELKTRRYSLQRLPRSASEPLDLSRLEAMV